MRWPHALLQSNKKRKFEKGTVDHLTSVRGKVQEEMIRELAAIMASGGGGVGHAWGHGASIPLAVWDYI